MTQATTPYEPDLDREVLSHQFGADDRIADFVAQSRCARSAVPGDQALLVFPPFRFVNGYQLNFWAAGGVHEPSMMAVFGQYARRYNEKSASFGDGSQFARQASGGGSTCT